MIAGTYLDRDPEAGRPATVAWLAEEVGAALARYTGGCPCGAGIPCTCG